MNTRGEGGHVTLQIQTATANMREHQGPLPVRAGGSVAGPASPRFPLQNIVKHPTRAAPPWTLGSKHLDPAGGALGKLPPSASTCFQ